jgi:hypothetical protein
MKSFLNLFCAIALLATVTPALSQVVPAKLTQRGDGYHVGTAPAQQIGFNGATPTAQRANSSEGYAGAATGTLTFSSNPGAADTVIAGTGTYTFASSLGGTVTNTVLVGATADASLADLVSAINFGSGSGVTYSLVTSSNAAVFAYAGATVAATGTLTSTGTNVSNGDTVTINTTVYTFETSLSGTANGQIHIGGSADASLLNLINAINHTGTPGTDYVNAAVDPTVSAATSVTSHAFVVTALNSGASANTVVTTKSAATLSWGGSTLAGGSSTLILVAKAAGTAGNSVATTETSSALSFGGSTLSGGTASPTATQEAVLLNELRDAMVQKGLIKGSP